MQSWSELLPGETVESLFTEMGNQHVSYYDAAEVEVYLRGKAYHNDPLGYNPELDWRFAALTLITDTQSYLDGGQKLETIERTTDVGWVEFAKDQDVKDNREDVRRLAMQDPPLSLGEIGEKLGITRQRVHQLLRAMGITKPRKKSTTTLCKNCQKRQATRRSTLCDVCRQKKTLREAAKCIHCGKPVYRNSTRCRECTMRLRWDAARKNAPNRKIGRGAANRAPIQRLATTKDLWRLRKFPHAQDESHHQQFMSHSPGWAIPENTVVAHYYTKDGVSLCLRHSWENTSRMPKPETDRKKCVLCQRMLERGYR